MEIFDEMANAKKSGKAFAVVTVIENNGHGTADPGKKMVQYEDGTFCGTVGGGIFEMAVMQQVAEKLKLGTSVSIIECANAKLLVECFSPDLTLVIVGGGHLGNAVLKAASPLHFRKILVDDRDESQLSESISLAEAFIKCTDYEKALVSDDIPEGAYIIIGAWNHDYDAQALKGALQKNPAYVGMVGSHQKAQKIFGQLRELGVQQKLLDIVHAPIGLDIADDSPEEIAFAIIAEILMIKNNGYGIACKDINDKFLSSDCEDLE